MKKARTKILAGMALLVGVVLTAGIVWAKATKTPVEGSASLEVLDLGKLWVDEEGVLHIRGMLLSIETHGALSGTGTVVGNLNIDLATGNGDQSFYVTETMTWETPWGETLTGTFEGRTSGTYASWLEEGRAVYHGSGDFAGMKFIHTFWGWYQSGSVDYEGIILDPHGE